MLLFLIFQKFMKMFYRLSLEMIQRKVFNLSVSFFIKKFQIFQIIGNSDGGPALTLTDTVQCFTTDCSLQCYFE